MKSHMLRRGMLDVCASAAAGGCRRDSGSEYVDARRDGRERMAEEINGGVDKVCECSCECKMPSQWDNGVVGICSLSVRLRPQSQCHAILSPSKEGSLFAKARAKEAQKGV